MLAWLKEHRTSDVARFVYQPWLDAAAKLDAVEIAAKIDKVEAHVLAWLNEHGTSEEAEFVYKSWLDAIGKLGVAETDEKIDKVEGYVLTWLKEHGTSEAADFVYKSWLEAGAPFDAIREYAQRWLAGNIRNPEAVYVLKFIARDSELPSPSIDDVIAWSTNFPDNPDTICRIASLVLHFGDGPWQLTLIDVALVALENIEQSRLADRGVRDATLNVLAWLCWLSWHHKYGYLLQRLDDVHLDLLTNSSLYAVSTEDEKFNFVMNPSLQWHVADMLAREVLDLDVDREPLDRFASWLDSWPDDRKCMLRSVVEVLQPGHSFHKVWSQAGTAPQDTAAE